MLKKISSIFFLKKNFYNFFFTEPLSLAQQKSKKFCNRQSPKPQAVFILFSSFAEKEIQNDVLFFLI